MLSLVRLYSSRKSEKAGLPPGSIVSLNGKRTHEIRISVFDFDESNFEEKEVKTVEECFEFKEKPTVTWINVDGVHKSEILEKFGTTFGLHPLVLEDIITTDQRPKMEDYSDYIFLVFRMLWNDPNSNDILSEQISLVVGPTYVLSFQEMPGSIFDPIRERIRTGKGRVRKMGADYLAYVLMDTVVDNYFGILEKMGEKIEMVEDALTRNASSRKLSEIHAIKRELLFLRKAVWPLREVIWGFQRAESVLIKEPTQLFLRDLYDHTVQVIDTIESFRDMTGEMLDIYLSGINNRLNEVMKFLAAITTIFMPLTLIAGIYGMNFKYMPELDWPLAYPAVLLLMLVVGVIMFWFFKKKKFL